MASSEIVFDRADPPPNGSLSDCNTGGTPILNLYELGTDPSVIVYGTSPVDGVERLWRWTCDPSDRDSGPITDEIEIVRGLGVDQQDRPLAAASCKTSECRTVTLTATLESGAKLSVTGTRRASAAALGGGGSFGPTAVISEPEISPRTKTTPFVVKVRAESWDLDSDASTLTHSWTAENAGDADGVEATFTWNTPGSYAITLATTDEDGNVNRRTVTVQLENRPPQISSIDVSLEGGLLTRSGRGDALHVRGNCRGSRRPWSVLPWDHLGLS